MKKSHIEEQKHEFFDNLGKYSKYKEIEEHIEFCKNWEKIQIFDYLTEKYGEEDIKGEIIMEIFYNNVAPGICDFRFRMKIIHKNSTEDDYICPFNSINNVIINKTDIIYLKPGFDQKVTNKPAFVLLFSKKNENIIKSLPDHKLCLECNDEIDEDKDEGILYCLNCIDNV